MKPVKVILLSLLSLFILGLGGAYLYFSNLPPEGELIVLAPGVPVSFSVDGGEAIEVAADGRHELSLAAGEHRVKVTSPATTERVVEIVDRKATVVPVIDEQCYVSLDISMSAYDMGDGARRAPRFVRSLQTSEPFELPYAHYTSPNDIPEQRTDTAAVMLLRSADCAEINALATAVDGR